MAPTNATDDGSADAAERSWSRPSLLPLVKVVTRKRILLHIRYPVNTLTRFLSMFIIFAVIFFGGRQLAGAALTDSLDGVIVGFFLLTLATMAYTGLAMNVSREAQWGTLERLFMSPHGFGTVMTIKTLVNICVSFVWGITLLVVMMLTTDRWLHVDPLTVVPLATLTLVSVVGIGFAFAGLALVYKRIESGFRLMQFVFIGLIAAPAGRVEALKLLPVSHGSYLTGVAMEQGVHLWEFSAGELGLLVATSAVYLLAGFYCFHVAQLRARKQGLMGQY